MKPAYSFALGCLLSSNCTLADDTSNEWTGSINYSGEYWYNIDGGLDDHRGVYIDNIEADLSYHYRADESSGAHNFYGLLLYNNSNTLSDELVGDEQAVSNIDNSYNTRIFELWYSYTTANERNTYKVGLYDLNSEFDVIETGALFIHSAHGIGTDYAQSGENGPSIFPSTSLGFSFIHRTESPWEFQFAVLDGVPGDPDHPDRTHVRLKAEDGALFATEINYRQDTYRLGIGAWHYSQQADPILETDSERRNSGYYGIYEVPIQDNRPGFWLRAGIAEPKINLFSHYIGTGIVFASPFSSRPSDSLGLAVAHARTGSEARDAAKIDDSELKKAETNIEFTWRFDINERLAIQPDIQYVINPGADSELDDAFVVGMRFDITLL